MRRRRPVSRSLGALGLRKVTVLVPVASVEGLRQFAHDLCRRQEAGTSHVAGEWRKLSPSAELMVDPERGARCAIRETKPAGADRYDWTVTLLGGDLPLAAGRAGELEDARSAAERALADVTDWRGLPRVWSGNYD